MEDALVHGLELSNEGASDRVPDREFDIKRSPWTDARGLHFNV